MCDFTEILFNALCHIISYIQKIRGKIKKKKPKPHTLFMPLSKSYHSFVNDNPVIECL